MANGQKVAYVRVSSADQNSARQRESLEKENIDRWFEEAASGKNMDRPQLQEMLQYIREGDAVYVSEFSRLGRSTADLLEIIKRIEDKGATVTSLKERLDTSTSTGKLMVTVIAAISEFERNIILERQAEGIAIAKRKGKYKGRKRVSIPDIGKYYDAYMHRETTKTEAAKKLGVSRNTLTRLFDEYREEQIHGKG